MCSLLTLSYVIIEYFIFILNDTQEVDIFKKNNNKKYKNKKNENKPKKRKHFVISYDLKNKNFLRKKKRDNHVSTIKK